MWKKSREQRAKKNDLDPMGPGLVSREKNHTPGFSEWNPMVIPQLRQWKGKVSKCWRKIAYQGDLGVM